MPSQEGQVKPQQHGSSPSRTGVTVCRSDIHPMQCRGAKSFVDDLGLSRGVVLSRAAASLRSIETKPFDWKICPLKKDTSSPIGFFFYFFIFIFYFLQVICFQRLLLHSLTAYLFIFFIYFFSIHQTSAGKRRE